MRDHSHESEGGLLRPKAARIEEEPAPYAARAAASGRTDVLSESDLIGLQRVVGNAGVGSVVEEERSPVHEVINSGGRPLEEPVRRDMEARLGHDFGDVRVHDDGAAHASAASVNAHAYTVGSHVVFQRDAYDPSSGAGQQTLAHELTHVVQQRSGPVDGTAAAGGISVSDPGDRFEREASATAEQAMSAPAPDHTGTTPDSGSAVQRSTGETALGIQREEGEQEDEAPVQQIVAQREEASEEEAEEPTG